jgi:hypothetical protein
MIEAARASQIRSIVRTTRAGAACSVGGEMPMQSEIPRPSILDGNVRTFSYPSVRTSIEEMGLAVSASKLRANIYRMLDQVLETGQPLEIDRNGKTLVIAPKEEQSIWDRLPRRKGFIVGDPDELIHMDWSSEWNPDPS